jgi:hypothetical protein
MYSSYSFLTSALDGGEWSGSRLGRALPPGKGPPVPIVQEAGWAPETVWTQRIEEKSFAPARDRTPIARMIYVTVQLAAKVITFCNLFYSVSIVSGYGLDDRAIQVRSPVEAK